MNHHAGFLVFLHLVRPVYSRIVFSNCFLGAYSLHFALEFRSESGAADTRGNTPGLVGEEGRRPASGGVAGAAQESAGARRRPLRTFTSSAGRRGRRGRPHRAVAGPPRSAAHLHGCPRRPMVARLGMPGAGGGGRAERSGPASGGRGGCRDVRRGRRAVHGRCGLWPAGTMKYLVSVGAGPGGRGGGRFLRAQCDPPAAVTGQLGALASRSSPGQPFDPLQPTEFSCLTRPSRRARLPEAESEAVY